jgi:hypothetical protein
MFLTPVYLRGNLPELRKRIFQIAFFALLLSAGIIALTQESDESIAVPEAEEGVNPDIYAEEFFSDSELARQLPEWVKPMRWFRSNAAGMALEEVPSRLAALRNKYALVIDFTGPQDLPEYLLQFYDTEYFIEIRTFFENGEEVRAQWIFRDINGTTRVLAVVIEDTEKSEIIDEVAHNDESIEDNIEYIETAYTEEEISGSEYDAIDAALETAGDNLERKDKYNKIRGLKNGFIEVYDKDSFLTMEYRYTDDAQDSKTQYFYKDGTILSAVSFLWEENSKGGEFVQIHTDYFRYNRSAFLRNVERVIFRDKKISSSEDSVRIAFPSNVMNAAQNDYFMSEKFNAYPEFFGDLFVKKNDKLVYTTDERGRIMNQTLYRKQTNSEGEEEEKVVWAIKNTWSGERIASITKTEGDTVLLANYEYDSAGDRVLERNLKNGILERLVRTEGKKDIEQLYLNNVVILQAVYEDGRKISETRMRGN